LKLQIVIDGKLYEVEVEDRGGDLPVPVPGCPGPPPRATIQSAVVATPLKPGSVPDGGGGDARVCRSPVAGIVARVIAQPGELLKVDDLVVVLEAMKMETNVKAPVTGKVRSIQVAVGEAVKINQLLADFE
jgi:methylmalonyl-CoA carboxyltransferase 1.3S subunit